VRPKCHWAYELDVAAGRSEAPGKLLLKIRTVHPNSPLGAPAADRLSAGLSCSGLSQVGPARPQRDRRDREERGDAYRITRKGWQFCRWVSSRKEETHAYIQRQVGDALA
jgi:hypothetical protein